MHSKFWAGEILRSRPLVLTIGLKNLQVLVYINMLQIFWWCAVRAQVWNLIIIVEKSADASLNSYTQNFQPVKRSENSLLILSTLLKIYS